jgi:hypothetical protein
MPVGIRAFDQLDFLAADPTFDFFFPFELRRLGN